MENKQVSPCFDLAWSSSGDTDKFGIIIKYSGICITTMGGKRRMGGPAYNWWWVGWGGVHPGRIHRGGGI